MQTISFLKACQDLAHLMQQVNDDHEPIKSERVMPVKNGKMSYLNGRITIDSDSCNGKPTIRGKRITVQTILEFLSAGESHEEIVKQYPSLELEDINACLIFAAQLMNHKYVLKHIA